jgi:hypothetical protein
MMPLRIVLLVLGADAHLAGYACRRRTAATPRTVRSVLTVVA